MSVAASFPLHAWENENEAERCVNTIRPLTHSSDLSREGLGMKPTRPTVASKACARCERDLPVSEFTPDPRMRSGLKSYCRRCCREDARDRYQADPERVRAVARKAARARYTPERGRVRHLKAMYGLTIDEYRSLLAKQGNACAICHTETPGGKGDWHIDHCHESGRIRGLLCAGCNVGIGHLGDDPARLRAAAAYIETHREAQP